MTISPLAGKPAPAGILVDVPRLITAYYAEVPDPAVPAERVAFGTSGHRGSSFNRAFNERHILAITQAICLYRKLQATEGPLFLGIDTHALSIPAFATALEVLAANGVEVMIADGEEYTPTPVISHAILTYNRGRKTGLSDGIVVTPSHNPPHDGGFKYNPCTGGPADTVATGWIESKANEILESRLGGREACSARQGRQGFDDPPARPSWRLCCRSRQCGRNGCDSRGKTQSGRRSSWGCRGALLGTHRRALQT